MRSEFYFLFRNTNAPEIFPVGAVKTASKISSQNVVKNEEDDDDIDVTSVTMAAKAMLDLLDEISLSEGLVSDTSKRNFRRQPMSYVDSERSLTLASQDSKVLQTQARVPSEKECPTTLNSRLAERTDRHSGRRMSDETKVGQNSMVSEVGTMFYQQPEMSFSTNTSKNSSRQHHPPNVSSNR